MNSFLILSSFLACLCLLFGAEAGDKDAKVLIIGCGPAAIQAAATLIENGINDFLCLCEGGQIRGYLESCEFGGRTFAPGSLWGYTPIKEKLDALNISYVVPNYLSYTVYNDAGDDVTAEAMDRENAFFQATDYGPVIQDLNEGLRSDFSEKIAYARGGWIASTAIDKVMEWFNSDFNEGRSARDTSTIQVYRQGSLIQDDYFILDERTLAYPLLRDQEAMINNKKFRFNKRAVVINQTEDGCVRVETESGREFNAEFAIVTSTVGVIQNGELTFDPPLPSWKTEEFCRYQMGTIDVIFLKFGTKFWDDTEFILHASDRHGYYPGFLNLEAEGYHPEGTNILLGFLTGDEAYRAELLSDAEVQAEVVEVLRNMYGADNVPDPTDFKMIRHATDKNLYGSFSTWPIGIIPGDDKLRLRAHVGRVYFAPEDAGDEYNGIAFGSIRSGREAAEEVAHCCEDEMYCEEDTILDAIWCRGGGEEDEEKGRKVE